MRVSFVLVVLVVIAVIDAASVRAQPAPAPAPADPAPARPAPADPAPADPAYGEPLADPIDQSPGDETSPPADEFGPLLMIELIHVTGNTATQTELIRRALPIQAGDVVRATDKRLRVARFKVLALGFFRDVTLVMNKGSARGQVILEVHVVERGTFVLNRLWFGTTSVSPYWLGADVGERNLLGLGVNLGGGFIYAESNGDIEGARDQWAGEVRLAASSIRGTRWGAGAAFTLVHGSETYRVAGTSGNPTQAESRAFPYRRFGWRAGTSYDVSALTRISASFRAEAITATLPVAPTQELADGRIVALDLHLDPGTSRVITTTFGLDRDTRPDPILPHAGGHLAIGAEIGTVVFGGDYQFATLFGKYEHYWPLVDERHAFGIKLGGGVVIGDAPRFDRIHIADVDRMLTPRALGLVLSSAAPLDILGTRAGKPIYGDLGGSASIEYAVQLFRGKGKKRVYGGDLFFGAGVWGLAETADLRARDTSIWNALPIDLYVDAGVRVDTDVGVFELTIANALGRLR
ncbi:MAG: BamA/TamA family outer membrane protein [Deltaproteobacteria bacterium]|nr:BamA/TamA family outer membrane protein [Deltaproteobacteria bacterium]MDQ3299851.1 BamA/TamA family outer membrane protein [Myxococcota bacterium]